MSFAKNLNKYSFHPCVFTIEPMLCNQNDLLVHILQVFHGVDYRDEIIDYHRSLAQSSEPQRDHALPSGMIPTAPRIDQTAGCGTMDGLIIAAMSFLWLVCSLGASSNSPPLGGKLESAKLVVICAV